MVLLSGPNINGNEWRYVKDCLDTGWVSSVGSYVSDFEKQISNYVGQNIPLQFQAELLLFIFHS